MLDYQKKFNLKRQDITVLDLISLKKLDRDEEKRYLHEYQQVFHSARSKGSQKQMKSKKLVSSKSISKIELHEGNVFEQIDDKFNPYSDNKSKMDQILDD